MYSIKAPGNWRRRLNKLFYLPLGRLLPALAYPAWYWGESEFQVALAALLASQPAVIHANDWEALPVAVEAARRLGARVVADLHEYAPHMWDDRRYWRWFYKPLIEYFLQKHLPFVDGSVTVGQTIAGKYAHEYGITPIVVMNAPAQIPNNHYRPTVPDAIQLVHHGVAMRERKLEWMIETLAHTDKRFSLHFMLVDQRGDYSAELSQLAQRLAPGRVSFHPAVAPANVVPAIAAFDIGFYLLPPVNFNHLAALPNKFFDFVLAGLAVCIGPSPEMARLCQQYGFGVVAPSFEPAVVGRMLNGLQARDIDQMKQRAIQAQAALNAETEMKKLLGLHDSLLSTKSFA
jgi:hypothetical protein